MADLSLIDFQIFPSRYEQNGAGEKCCWVNHNQKVELGPYQTDAIKGHSNPAWGFHLLSTGQPDKYRLKYVLMSDPLKHWFGVSVDDGKLVLLNSKEGLHFTVKKLGDYYTLSTDNGYVECEDGNLGNSTTIQIWDSKPPTTIISFSDIPSKSFRLLWKFVKMDHMNGRNWMTRLAATKSAQTIDQLFIPGTHDSGTEKNTQMNQTQFHTIAEQVTMGVRYFDLRVDTNWQLFHGADSAITLKQVIEAITTHLKSNSDEFFILQLTPYEKASFAQLLYNYLIAIDKTFFDKYLYTSAEMPTMSTAKGKIFFFCRNYIPKFEQTIDWADNTDGSYATSRPFTTASSPKLYVQDHYSGISDSTKFDNCVKPALIKMFSKTDTDWVLNFTSVANKYPIHSAENINPWVANWMMWNTARPNGILVVDDARPGNIANIIAQNFK